MQYISGIHALNLPCSLETCGDWHQSALQWQSPQTRESKGSFFGDYGIEEGHFIPEHGEERFAVANTIRACLDLLYESNFPTAQGMNKDYICNERYDEEVFRKVYSMHDLDSWDAIDRFMHKEYRSKWIHFLKRSGYVQK